jgi:hypothetical protein
MRSRLRVIIGGAAQFANDVGSLRPRITKDPVPILFAFAEGRGVTLVPPPADERRGPVCFAYKYYETAR